MARTRQLEVKVVGDVDDVLRAFGRVDKATGKTQKSIGGFASVSSTGFTRVGAAARGMQVVAGGAAAFLAKRFVGAASDINESLSKNQVLFGRYAKDIDRFSRTSARSFGISRQAALDYTGVFGNLFRALGTSQRESAKFSVGLTRLAADMASFNNTSIQDALEAIRSGLVGESEPLRRFGVNLNDATLRNEALRQGLVRTTKEALTPQQKALATQALLFRQTAAAQGDFGRTSSGLANQQRILSATISDLGARAGAFLLPTVLRATAAINQFARGMQNGTGAGGRFVTVSQSVGNALGGVANAVRSVVGWFGRHRTATTVLLSTVAGLTTAVVAYRTAAAAATVATGAWATAQTVLNVAMRANPIALIATAVIGLGAALVVTYRRSDTFREKVDSAFRTVKSAASTLGRIIDATVVQPFLTLVRVAGRVIDKLRPVADLLSKISGVARGIGGALGGAANALGGLGDGLGVPPIATGGGPINLMGARPALAPLAAIGASAGLRVSSGARPGSITSTGNTSWHSSGEAIDLAGSPAGMMRTFQTLKRGFGPRLAELIYTPGGAGIKNGQPHRYSGQVAADHYDHVHVAMDVGKPGIGDGIGEAARAARTAGFTGQDLITAVAVAGPESSYRNSARLVTGAEDSRGMWQINTKAHPWALKLNLQNSTVAARAARRVWQQAGGSWGPWTGYTSGAYRGFLDRAREAVRGLSGRSQTQEGTRGGSAPSAATGPSTSRYEARRATADLRLARAQATPGARDDVKAFQAQRGAVQSRIKAVQRKLHRRGLSRGTRARLQQELAGLIQERTGLDTSIKEARTSLLPAQAAAGGDLGGEGGPSPEEEAEQRRHEERMESERLTREAFDAHRQQLEGVRAEMKRQTDFATQAVATQNYQAWKALADIISGQIGGRARGRGFTPGGGVEFAY